MLLLTLSNKIKQIAKKATVLKTPTCSAPHSGHSSHQRKWLRPPTQGRGWLPAEDMNRDQWTQQPVCSFVLVCESKWFECVWQCGKANTKSAQRQVRTLFDWWTKMGFKIWQKAEMQEGRGEKQLSCETQKTHQVNWKWQRTTTKYLPMKLHRV